MEELRKIRTKLVRETSNYPEYFRDDPDANQVIAEKGWIIKLDQNKGGKVIPVEAPPGLQKTGVETMGTDSSYKTWLVYDPVRVEVIKINKEETKSEQTIKELLCLEADCIAFNKYREIWVKTIIFPG